MKKFLWLATLGLAAFSVLLYWTLPDAHSKVPVLYWITQSAPTKWETVRLFEQWLKDKGLPPVKVLIDNVNQDPTKKLAQGLAGVGADIYDIYQYEPGLFADTGMIMDVTAQAKELGFSPAATYPALKSDMVFNGKQYYFPRNVGGSVTWINRDTFARYHQPEPPDRWSWDQFEAMGKQFVAAANAPNTHARVYYIQSVSVQVLRRGLGLSIFNETMTQSRLDDPRNAEVMRRYYRWVIQEHLVPTLAEINAMAANSSMSGDATFHLFRSGRYAMLYIPRWALIRLRPLGKLNFRIVEPFNSGFPNMEFGGGMIGIYARTKHPKEAVRFLQFLTSRRFNLLIARAGDSLPPVPEYTHSAEFLRPPEYPDEWEAQKQFAHLAGDLGIAYCRSPYIMLGAICMPVMGIESQVVDAVLAGRMSPEDAGRVEAERINTQIAINVKQDEALRARYARDVAVQRKIDARRAKGEPVPLEWITNPFYRKYYAAQGWLEQESAAEGAAREAKP